MSLDKMLLVSACLSAALVAQAGAQTLGGLPPELTGFSETIDIPEDDPFPAQPATAQDGDPAPPTAQDDPRGQRGRPAPAGDDDQPAIEIDPTLTRPKPEAAGHLPRQCECVTPRLTQSGKIRVQDIRDISNEWCDGGDDTSNSFGLTNMVWAWGQFIDHDVVGSEPEEGAPTQFIFLDGDNRMEVPRVGPDIGDGDDGECGGPGSTHTGQVDGTPIYGTDEETLHLLIDPNRGGCFLRETPGPQGGFLPIALETMPSTNQYSPSVETFFVVAGDPRVEEHAILTTMHTVWLREHNRLCEEMQTLKKTKDLTGEEQFEIAQATVIAKMQTITLEEFLPSLGIRDRDLKNAAKDGFDIEGIFATVEFSIAYRLGHTLIPSELGALNLGELFNSQNFFLDRVDGGVAYREDADAQINRALRSLATVPAAELDGKMSNALRNILFGPTVNEDLCSRNIYRGRDLHLPTYRGLAECFGVHPDHQTEMETPDAWLGLLREPKENGKPLGPTLEAIIVEHFARTFFGPEGNFWRNDRDGLKRLSRPFAREIRRTTLAKVISANTDANLEGNVFLMD